ncbi:MAG: aldo/keto reductase [Nitrospirota bacterium]|nr:MAG: aldo/keto reductase [Nitrospirota bacterium]
MATPLPTRVLGRTNVRLPILGFGTAPAGKRLNLKDAVQLYESALNQGITYFDTAPEFAGYGKAQVQLGHLLKERRNEVFLVTKCYEPTGDAALKLLERSLRELQTDFADLVFVHSLGADKMDPQIVFSPRGTYPALIKAKQLGLARFVGLSGHNRPQRFAEAIQKYEVDVLLNVSNFVDRYTYNFEQRVWSLVTKQQIGLIAMKVYGGESRSLFSGISNSVIPQSYLDLAFRYALSQPQVACAVIGMATLQELKENLARVQGFTPLQDQERAQLASIGKRLAKGWGAHFGAVS